MEETRRFVFTLQEAQSERGVVMEIGRASQKDPSRVPCVNNLFYDERSLSRHHAQLGLKLMEPLEMGKSILEQFRIYVKDLGSTYGIIDLNSQESDPYVVDLKNGERFGLVQLQRPISVNQCRAAKLKFQVNVVNLGDGVFECLLKDVSFDDSPLTTRPATFDENTFFKELEISPTSSLEKTLFDELENSSSSSSLCGLAFEGTPCAHEEEQEDSDWTSDSWSRDGSSSSESIESTVSVELSCKHEETIEPTKQVQMQPEEQKAAAARPKRPLPEETEEEHETQKEQEPARKRMRFNVISKRDIVTAAIGVVIGSFGTIGILIGIANKLE